MATSENPQNKIQPKAKDFRVLVVDDNFINQKVAVGILARMGLESVAAVGGAEALDLMSHTPIHLVLMDCYMPVMDGFEATRQIREQAGEVAQIPIIAMTSSLASGERERCIASGMNDFIPKPVNTDELRLILKRWIIEDESALSESDADTAHFIRLALKEGSKSYGNEMAIDIFQAFLDYSPIDLAKLERYALEKNFVAAHRAAHDLKTTATLMGCRKIARWAEQVELVCGDGDLKRMLPLIGSLGSAYKETEPILEESLAQYKGHYRTSKCDI